MCGGGGSRHSSTSSSRRTSTGQTSGGRDRDEEPQSAVRIDDNDDPCDLNETIDLDGTEPDVLDDVNIGDIFVIEYQDGRLCVVDYEGRVVGSILGSHADRLEECMEQGWEYSAEVVAISGRTCEVFVTQKCPINEEAMLASPDPEVLQDVAEGDEYEVTVREETLCVVNDAGEIIGPIAEGWTGILIDCIESGWEYRAQISVLDGGNCTVQVFDVAAPE